MRLHVGLVVIVSLGCALSGFAGAWDEPLEPEFVGLASTLWVDQLDAIRVATELMDNDDPRPCRALLREIDRLFTGAYRGMSIAPPVASAAVDLLSRMNYVCIVSDLSSPADDPSWATAVRWLRPLAVELLRHELHHESEHGGWLRSADLPTAAAAIEAYMPFDAGWLSSELVVGAWWEVVSSLVREGEDVDVCGVAIPYLQSLGFDRRPSVLTSEGRHGPVIGRASSYVLGPGLNDWELIGGCNPDDAVHLERFVWFLDLLPPARFHTNLLNTEATFLGQCWRLPDGEVDGRHFFPFLALAHQGRSDQASVEGLVHYARLHLKSYVECMDDTPGVSRFNLQNYKWITDALLWYSRLESWANIEHAFFTLLADDLAFGVAATNLVTLDVIGVLGSRARSLVPAVAYAASSEDDAVRERAEELLSWFDARP